MKVKIGDIIYDSEDQPIMLILGEDDKYNIETMREGESKYVCLPEGGMLTKELFDFMGEQSES